MNVMIAMAVICFVLALGCLVWAAADQRKLWWKMDAWRYSDPEANEPSDTALTTTRIALFFLAIGLAGAGVFFLHDQAKLESHAEVRPDYPIFSTTPPPDPSKAKTYSRAEVRQMAEAIAAELGGKLSMDVKSIITAKSDDNLRYKNPE